MGKQFLRITIPIIICLAWLISLPACVETHQVNIMTRRYMATFFTISIAEKDLDLSLFETAFKEIERIENMMSFYLPDSDVSRINRQAGIEAVSVHPDLLEVIKMCLEVSARTGGRFDVTYPSSSADSDFRDIILDEKISSVLLKNKGMKIDLGAIAKGYAVDKAASVLLKQNVRNFIINGGGDILVYGQKFNQPWQVGVRNPRNKTDILHPLKIRKNMALATSGDYEQFQHITDPVAGTPALSVSSVTILSKNATLADAYATAVFVLGTKKGMDVVNTLDDIEVLLIDSDGNEFSSKNFWEQLGENNPVN